ncbi:MAG: hypothetical protein AAF698_04790, partial [Pseudomonadota bacterium]
MFGEQLTQATKTMEAWQKPTRDAFEFWISFFPVAPAFGIAWRFADMPGMPAPAAKAPATAVTAKPKPAPKAAA